MIYSLIHPEMSELCESQSELGINVRLDGSPYHR